MWHRLATVSYTHLNYIPHKKYTNADFNIEAYKSNIDKDNDGIDDQTDILNNACGAEQFQSALPLPMQINEPSRIFSGMMHFCPP